MVLGHDPSVLNETKNSLRKSYKPATRLDRFAANIVDLAIVFTLSKVIAAKSIQALRISVNFDLNYSLLANLFNIFWLSFSVFLLYKVITFRIFKRTLGQFLFSLQIVSTAKNKKLDQFTIVLRSLLSFMGMLAVFPAVSLLINHDGKTFYDKICDTLVVSTKSASERYNFYFPYERVLSSLLVFGVFLVSSLTSLYLMQHSFGFKQDFTKNTKLCDELNNYHDSWTKNHIEDSRLEVALALYSAGELAAECLKKEIDFELSINNLSSTAYFAKGLLSFENDLLVIRYFKKACQIDVNSPACHVATWISVWPNRDEEERPLDFSSLPTFAKVWLIKRDYQKGNVYNLKKNLDSFNVPTGLEGFFAENKMRTDLYSDNIPEFESILRLTNNKNTRSRNLTENFCTILIGDSCSRFYKIKTCKSFPITRSTDTHLQNMLNACRGREHRVFSHDNLLEAYYQKKALREPFVLNDLKLIFMNKENPFSVRFATMNSFFNQVTSVDYLMLLKLEWESASGKDYFWRLLGENLKDKFKFLGDQQSSYLVYKDLASEFDEIKSNTDILMPPSIKLITNPTLNRVPTSEKSNEKKINQNKKGF